MKRLYRKTKHWTLWISASVIILATVLILSGRALTPILNRHLPDFQSWIQKSFNQPVTIGKASISWSGYEPGLAFEEVKILNKETLQPVIDIHYIKLTIDLIRSLLARQIIFDKLKITGVHLIVREQASGEFNVGGLYGFSVNDSLTGATVEPNKVLTWIFSQPKLWMREVEIRYISSLDDTQSILFDNLALKNSSTQHSIKGQAILQQQLPTKIEFNIDWNGDVSELINSKGKAYLYVEDVSLPQWVEQLQWHDWQIKQGIGNVKLWIKWQDSKLQGIQSQFQLYNLTLQSPHTTTAQVIPRLGGQIEWARAGANQILTGKDVLINLSNHLWPKTNFSVLLVPQANDWVIKTLEISYLDLADTQKWLLLSGLLPAEFDEPLANLNPHGEITQFKMGLPVDNDASLENATVTGELSHVSFNEWHNYPGVKNLSSVFNWTQGQGNFSLNSQDVIMSYKKLFSGPLKFTSALGDFNISQSPEKKWMLIANNLKLTNQDLNINSNFSIKFNDIPYVDLTANFSVNHAENIIHYLPAQNFSVDLTKWLTQAFHLGQVSSGIAEFKGNLNEFPFVKGEGKFLISGMVNNLEFSYDPEWPVIHGLHGKLVFSGDSMIVDADKGSIYDVTFSKAHAVLTNLVTAEPSILKVSSNFASNLSKGLYFINHSPLQKQFSQSLGNLHLTGPIDLSLDLVIPIDNPAETKVAGHIRLLQPATLNMPEWGISIEKLQGAVNFTEDGITAANLPANMFGEEATLSLLTQELQDKQKFVQINLQSQIKIAELQKWLKIPLDTIIKGVTSYQLKIDLPPRGSNESLHLTLQSNLQGISVKLPSPYQKMETTENSFKFELFSKPLQALQMKLHYGNLLSIAMTAEQGKQNLKLISGEIHLGEGEADWQTTPGFIITGHVDQFNFKVWQDYFDSFKTKASDQLSDWWRKIDVFIDKLTIFDFTFDQIHVQISPADNAWQVGLTNTNLQGQLIIPMSLSSSATIDAKFQRFYWPADNTMSQNKWDPKTFPAISFVGDDVRYDDKKLGKVTLNLTHTVGGLAINALRIESAVLNLDGIGSWRLQNNQYTTHLSGHVTTHEVSKLLNSWGVSHTNLVANNGDVRFDLNWPDAPYKPKIAAMSGNISMKFGEGRIIDLGSSNNAKIGIGRMLSILNLQTLPRRLSLNFSDLVEKGYSFDYIKGDFSLRNGDAFTQNMRLNGPVAKIEILGRVGLGDKDYDLNMSITPYVTSSIPLVATIAGGPVAGMAAWVVDRVVSKAVSSAATYHYKVTGSWDQPVWQSVGSKQ